MSDKRTQSASDLRLRLVSAALMIPFALWIVWQGGVWLALGCSVFAAAMAYEWVRMSASPMMKSFVPMAMIPVLIAALIGPLAGIGIWILSAILGGGLHPLAHERRHAMVGLAYIAGMPMAMYLLRESPFEAWNGLLAALTIMGMVWGSDSAAYFTGRGFGGPPLTPESPSKTWSGAIGAVVFTALCGLLAAKVTGGNWVLWVFAGVMISVFAQMGDLIESRIKRRYGVKDASGLIPGHGGFMDRVDGLGIVCGVSVIVLFSLPNLVRGLGLTP